MTNLYEVLGVAKDARLRDIREAYLRLAKEHHPDRGGDPEKFKVIKRAYETLSSAERRKLYDETGSFDGPVDDGGKSTVLTVISEMLDAIVEKALNDGVSVVSIDIPRVLIVTLEADKRQLVAQVATVKKLQESYRRLQGRFTRDDGEPNLFESILRSKEEGVRNALAQIEKQKAQCDEVIAFVREYRFEMERLLTSASGKSGLTPERLQTMLEMLNRGAAGAGGGGGAGIWRDIYGSGGGGSNSR